MVRVQRASVGFLIVCMHVYTLCVVSHACVCRIVPHLPLGMLSSWFRMKYPGSVDGAIAASAPILQFTGLAPDTSYSSIATNTYRSASQTCADGIEASWGIMQKFAATPAGLAQLSGGCTSACTAWLWLRPGWVWKGLCLPGALKCVCLRERVCVSVRKIVCAHVRVCA